MERICEVFHSGVYDVREPVVRCANCENLGRIIWDDPEIYWCTLNEREVEPDGFCYWGDERGER